MIVLLWVGAKLSINKVGLFKVSGSKVSKSKESCQKFKKTEIKGFQRLSIIMPKIELTRSHSISKSL